MKAMILFVLSASLSAQSAKVIQLDAATSAEATQLYAQRAEIDKKIEALKLRISIDHIWSKEACEDPSTPDNVTCTDSGWENSFVFSEDFKYIVPKPNGHQNTCSAPLTGWVHEALDDGSMPAESSMPLWDQDRHYYFHASGGGNTEGPVQEEWGDAGGYGNPPTTYRRPVKP